MNKKLKIYLFALLAAAGVASIVFIFDQVQRSSPEDLAAPAAEDAAPTAPTSQAQTEAPAPLPIPETPNGVLPTQPAQAITDTDIQEKKDVPEKKSDPNPVAKSEPPAWRTPTLEDLEKLRSENALLEAQLRNAELRAKIGGISPNSSNAPSSGTAPIGPRVVMIAGAQNRYRANIMMPTGPIISAGIGTSIAGYGPITAITPNEVVVGSGSNRRVLPLLGNTADGF